MSREASMAEEFQKGPIKPPKIFSCVLCAQRKVKCDKKQPCSNCAKAGVDCIIGAPPKPRSRRRRVPEVDLIGRLQRYEQLLLQHGVKREDFENLESPKLSRTAGASTHDIITSSRSGNAVKVELPSYFHSNVWSTLLSDEILEVSSDDERDLSIHERDQLGPSTGSIPAPDIGFILFNSPVTPTNLTALHPQAFQIFKLWQTYLDNVHPLVKILHAPSVQQEISRASGSPQSFSRPMEALMFSIYSCSVNAMSDEECRSMLNEDKSSVFHRLIGATQHALMNANLLTSPDMMVLQAFVLFLLSIRKSYDPQALWVLTGIAVRLAEGLGLHREPLLAKMSAFDAEFGRRLFWQIVILDGHTSSRARVDTSLRIHLWDTKLPLNVNDSDLDINMRELPKEHTGVTEMVFCLVRCEFGNRFHNRSSQLTNTTWQLLSDSSIPMSRKEEIITELESVFEEKFLKYCDPGIPLQLLSIVITKIMIGRLRLSARHPRRLADRGASMSQEEKGFLFDICLTMIEKDNKCHSSSGVRKFLWHINVNFQLDSFVYVLNELRQYCIGERADQAWREILECFDHHPDLLTDTKNQLYVAIGNLTLKSWGVRKSMFAELGQVPPEGCPPQVVSILRSQRSKVLSPGQYPRSGQRVIEADREEAFAPTPITAMAPIDWGYWNDMMDTSYLTMGETVQSYQQVPYDAQHGTDFGNEGPVQQNY